MFEAPSSVMTVSRTRWSGDVEPSQNPYSRIAADRAPFRRLELPPATPHLIVSGGVLVADRDRQPDLDRVLDRILAPFEPTAVVDSDPLPTLKVGVEPGLTRAPACAAIEGDPFVG